MAERHGSRWTEEQIERGADALEQRLDQHATWEDGAAAVLEAVFPVGEPDDERLVEKVAATFWRDEIGPRVAYAWEDEPGWSQEVYRKQARAAVAAVRAAGENPE